MTLYTNIKLAYRDSKTATRPYVLVNPRLAKHMPTVPSQALEYFAHLGAEVAKTCAETERILVIGFAETATAVGAAVATAIGNAKYVHTTREPLPAENLVAVFSEEHSHAKEQALYLHDEQKNLKQYDRIIFVEDEITTGKTILNFLRNIGWNGKITVSALVYNGFDENAFSEYDATFACLQKIDYTNDTDLPINNEPTQTRTSDISLTSPQTQHNTHSLNIDKNDHDATSPRLGIDIKKYNENCAEIASQIIAKLHADDIKAKDILVMGTEECMYPALYLGRELEHQAKSVKSQSTTRSPLLPKAEENYPLRTRNSFASVYDSTRTTYLYNLEKYDTVIVLTDSQNTNCDELLHAIQERGNQVIYFVRSNH